MMGNGKVSLIEAIDYNKQSLGYFETFENDKFSALSEQHSQELAKSKYKVRSES
jgi:hypothetical protein